MSIKISKISTRLIFELFLLYQIVFIKFPYIKSYTTIQRLAVIFLFIMILPNIMYYLKKMNFTIKSLIIAYLSIIIISSVINKDKLIMTNTLIGGIMYVLIFLELFIIFSDVVKKKSIQFIIKEFLFLTFFYVLITDILIFINPSIFSGGYYFIGNKFSVAYKHLELIVLLFMNRKIKIVHKKNSAFLNILIFCSVILGLMISNSVNTMTGIVSIILLLVILLFLKEKLLYNSIFFIIILISSALFIMVINSVMTWNITKEFIFNILHRDLTLTGRIMIYNAIPKLIKGHILFGYGYNSSYEVWTNYTSYMPNAQNGLINCVFEQGLIATIILILLIRKIISKSIKSYDLKKIYKPLISLLYVYSIIATIEITIDINFIGWLALFYTSTLTFNSFCNNELDKCDI